MSVNWNPWHGCRKISEGCLHCYVYRQDAQWGADSSMARRTSSFYLPTRRDRTGRFKVGGGQMVYTCFTSDFLLEEADPWRDECWQMMSLRRDLQFMFFTKRIARLADLLPADWGEGYENVTIGCTVENQRQGAANTPQDNRRRTAVVASRHTALARRRHRGGKHRRGVGQRSESMPLRVGRRYQKAVRRDRHSVPVSPDRCPVDKGRPTVSHRPPVAAFAGAECGSRLRHLARLRAALAIRQRDRPPSNLGSSVGAIP